MATDTLLFFFEVHSTASTDAGSYIQVLISSGISCIMLFMTISEKTEKGIN